MSKRTSSVMGWGGKDLLGLFLVNSIDNHTPRSNTGEVYIQKEGNVCCVQKTETLPRVFRKLSTEGFLGMPVMDGKRYVGFITMLDMVKYVNGLFWADTEEDWIDYWEKSESFAETTVEDVMQVPDQWIRDPSPPLLDTMSSMYALELMVYNNQHRMVTVDSQSERVCSILTQSMLISFLRQTKDRWGSFGNITVRSMIPELKHEVITTLGTDNAINAFNKMEDNEVYGIAIVDTQGRLKGSISLRDLRGVGSDGTNFFRLYNTVSDFKKAVRSENPSLAPSSTHYEQARTPVSGLFVTPEQSIGDVIEKMHDGNIHRIYVCRNRQTMVPTHVISQRDVLRAALEHIIELAGGERNVEMEEMEEKSSDDLIKGNGKRVRSRTSPTTKRSMTTSSSRSIAID